MSKRTKKRKKTVSAIVIADTHCGSLKGLINPKVKTYLDNGGVYHPSDKQLELWKLWRAFWDEWVPLVTRGDDYCIIHCGDLVDGDHHGCTEIISANPITQGRIAYDVMMPEIAKAKGGYYQLRGTSSHSGESGRAEEGLAQSMGAVPNIAGQYSRPYLWISVGGCRLLAQHTIGVTSSTAYEATAPMRTLAEAFSRSARSDDDPPDVMIRAHRHSFVKVDWQTERGVATICTLPSWQLPTNYAQEKGFLTSQHGGILVRDGDEEFYTRAWCKFVKLGKPEELGRPE